MSFTRRKFLAAVTAAAAARAAAAQKRPPEARSYYGGLRVGLNTGCYPKLALPEVLAKVREFGLKYVEVAPVHGNLLAIKTAETRDVRRRVLDAGISIHSYGPLRLNRGDRGKLDAVFERAQELALRTLIVEAGGALQERLAERAEAARINVALHGPPVAAETFPKRLGIALDSSVPDAAAEAARLGERLFAVHLAPGNGAAPLAAALLGMAYDGIAALEYDDAGDVDANIHAGLEILRR